ncbi:hypothetical protein B0H66DRAFT_552142 [Apodospora peruviana]|uniref:Uncharacterized protein n=1 Tax=Apodospora peruviana TaxID=516989 RepID=A0AAE0IAK7_9PEZI|nr:hypothetical protein B0H66DRAFT_552142 [Apodospora peruviana]
MNNPLFKMEHHEQFTLCHYPNTMVVLLTTKGQRMNNHLVMAHQPTQRAGLSDIRKRQTFPGEFDDIPRRVCAHSNSASALKPKNHLSLAFVRCNKPSNTYSSVIMTSPPAAAPSTGISDTTIFNNGWSRLQIFALVFVTGTAAVLLAISIFQFVQGRRHEIFTKDIENHCDIVEAHLKASRMRNHVLEGELYRQNLFIERALNGKSENEQQVLHPFRRPVSKFLTPIVTNFPSTGTVVEQGHVNPFGTPTMSQRSSLGSTGTRDSWQGEVNNIQLRTMTPAVVVSPEQVRTITMMLKDPAQPLGSKALVDSYNPNLPSFRTRIDAGNQDKPDNNQDLFILASSEVDSDDDSEYEEEQPDEVVTGRNLTSFLAQEDDYSEYASTKR